MSSDNITGALLKQMRKEWFQFASIDLQREIAVAIEERSRLSALAGQRLSELTRAQLVVIQSIDDEEILLTHYKCNHHDVFEAMIDLKNAHERVLQLQDYSVWSDPISVR